MPSRVLYDGSVLDRVLRYIRKHGLIRPGDRVGVAVSGGADSVALLRLLMEMREQLGIVLSVVHFNHKIRGAEADADEQFVRELAQGFDLEFHSGSDDTPAYAAEHKLSLEAAGRKLRYGFFDRLTVDHTVLRVATAHTRDDQAETVLLRFLRGAGTKGLAGIYPGIGGWVAMSSGGGAPAIPPGPRIVRPLLEITRAELRAYLEKLGQPWREDVSNLDVGFTRNRLRHEIMPLLRQLNPNLDHVLSDTAEIARAEESWWEQQQANVAQKDLCVLPSGPPRPGQFEPPRVRVDALLSLPLALQRRLVRLMAEHPEAPLGFDHVEAVLGLAASEPSRSEKVIELPNGVDAVRQDRQLWFRQRCESTEQVYVLSLRVPGESNVAGRTIRAALVHAGATGPEAAGTYVSSALLDPSFAKSELVVRNWRAGDRYQPAHVAAPKKLKELLQARHIPREQKPFWPVVVSGDQIVWVPGFDAPEQFRVRNDASAALLLEELPLGQSAGIKP